MLWRDPPDIWLSCNRAMDGDMAAGAGGIGDIAELLLMLCNPRRFIASSFKYPYRQTCFGSSFEG